MADPKKTPAHMNLPFPMIRMGAGDVIAMATKAMGFKECESCAKRKAALNRALSIGSKADEDED